MNKLPNPNTAEKKTELNSRQWQLYRYLKKHKGEWKKLDEVIAETGLYNESRGYRTLKADIRALKNSEVIQMVLSTDTVKGVKLATKKEYAEYSKRRWKAIIKMIELQRHQDKKAGLDGQYRLVFNQEKPVIESFVKEAGA